MTVMTPEQMRNCIRQAARACTDKDAIAFAALFLAEGEIILGGAPLVGREEIEGASRRYFETCGEIAIAIHRIVVEGSCAVVEWSWNSTDNAIAIDFKDGAIARWREYRS